MGEVILVTGTDTGVGKTHACMLLIDGFFASQIPFSIVKPVETGCGERMVPPDGQSYASKLESLGRKTLPEEISMYLYREPLSPNIAARICGDLPDRDRIKKRILGLSGRGDMVLVEGAGGVMVEIIDGYTFLDLALELGMLVLLIAPNRLGVLNHVSLSVEVLESRGARFTGVILNDISPTMDGASQHNFDELVRKYGEKVLGRIMYGESVLPGDIITKLLG